LAVPGNPLDPRARGTNKLIREGAVLIEGADDVLEALAGTGAGTGAGSSTAEPGPTLFTNAPAPQKPDEQALSTAREEITALLGAAPTPIDEIPSQQRNCARPCGHGPSGIGIGRRPPASSRRTSFPCF